MIDINKDPYGQSGGLHLSASHSASVLLGVSASVSNAFWYHPVSASTATVVLANVHTLRNTSGSGFSITSGSSIRVVFPTAGGGDIYGQISSVTQSSGQGILYYKVPPAPRYP